MSAEGNHWYVKLPDGDVHRITLDELDAAFQAGHIDENTMVLAAGADQWARLGDLAGADDDAATHGETAAEVPLGASVGAAMPVVAAAPITAGPSIVTRPGTGTPTTVAPPTYAAPAHRAPPAYVPFATSIRPVSVDLGETGGFVYPKPKRSRWVFGSLAVALVVGGVGFAVQRTALGSHHSPPTAAAELQAPPAPPPPPPVAPPPEAANPQQHLSDDLKTKLLEADKQRDTKAKTRRPHSGGESHAAAPKSKASPVFTTGGNKYDPLNSNL